MTRFFDPPAVPHGGRDAAATHRNRDAIFEVLKDHLPAAGLIAEISSGTGQHITHFAQQCPALTWQPTDMDEELRASVVAWTQHFGLKNVLPPIALDTRNDPWPLSQVDVLFNANMIHIAPWAACEGLMRGAGRVLKDNGVLFMYGPYKKDGAHTAPSNLDFDQHLRSRDASWGVRDMEAVAAEAEKNGLRLAHIHSMPANNFSLVFVRA